MKILVVQIMILLLTVGLSTDPAVAQVSLQFAPADTTVGPGALGTLSIFIDTPDLDVRSLGVYVDYDTTVVRSLGGGAGHLFTSGGFMVFDGIDHSVPGQWHGYAVIINSEDYLTGPGELYRWDFEALAGGVSPITAVQAYVAAADGTYYAEVTLAPTTLTVLDPYSPAGDLPHRGPQLKAWPNPFNPRTTLTVVLPTPGPTRLSVVDLRGREVAVLHRGSTPAGPSTYAWDGCDDLGRTLPGGMYLFRLDTPNATTTAKGLLVK